MQISYKHNATLSLYPYTAEAAKYFDLRFIKFREFHIMCAFLKIFHNHKISSNREQSYIFDIDFFNRNFFSSLKWKKFLLITIIKYKRDPSFVVPQVQF